MLLFACWLTKECFSVTKREQMDKASGMKMEGEKREFYKIDVPVNHQARFTMVAVFRESVEFIRDYTLPFNMLDVCSRSEGKDASRVINLKTGESYSSRVNLISLCPCNLKQQYRHTLRNEHLCIHFKLELFPGMDVFSGQDHVIKEYSPELANRAREIFEIKDAVLCLSQCQEFALHFCHRHWPKRYAFELEPIRRFSDVLEYIRSVADARTEVGELARIMHLPESTFCRSFHEVFKIPPKAFLQRELLSKALRLLMMPDMTVKQASKQLNFTSEFYFSHFFKRLSGQSPKQYREKSSPVVGRKTHVFC